MSDAKQVPPTVMLGVPIMMAALCVFVFLATQVTPGSAVEQIDRRLSTFFERAGQEAPAMIELMHFITLLGDKFNLAALIAIVSVCLAAGRQWLLLATWLAAQSVGAALNVSLKLAFERGRPQFGVPLVSETSFSFPSGHSMGSAIAYGSLIYLALRGMRPGWLRGFTVALLTALVVAIGFSRIYLGAHWPSDVIGGFAQGIAVVVGSVTLAETLRWRKFAATEAPPAEHPQVLSARASMLPTRTAPPLPTRDLPPGDA